MCHLCQEIATENVDEVESLHYWQKENKTPFKPPQPPISMGDEKTKRMYKEAWQDYYQYLSRALEHRRQVWRLWFKYSKIIFYTV